MATEKLQPQRRVGNPTRSGLPRHPFGDFYHWLLRASWVQVIAMLGAGYLAVNGLFAVLYRVGGACYGDPDPSLFSAFMFSVQTFATIGYGVMSPQSLYAHWLVAIEAFVGIITVGMSTGLMFAKFSKPTARVAFANNIVVTNRFGRPTLQIRMANERRSEILSARVEVFVLKSEITPEGQQMRRFFPMKLERDASPIFALSWIVIHPIDDDSPVRGLSPETLGGVGGIVVNVQGVDDSFGTTVYARRLYTADEIAFGRQFADMISPREGGLHIDHSKLHELTDPR